MSDDPKKLDWVGIAVTTVTILIPVIYSTLSSTRERAITDLQLQQQTTLNQVYFREMERIKDKAEVDQIALAKLQQRVEDDEKELAKKQ